MSPRTALVDVDAMVGLERADPLASFGPRCVGGQLMQHRPQPDDPDFEVCLGRCPDWSVCNCQYGIGDAEPIVEHGEGAGT